MQCYLADCIAELLDILKVRDDGVAVVLGQPRDCSEQNVRLSLCRVLAINPI
jgi:hypothetical protein